MVMVNQEPEELVAASDDEPVRLVLTVNEYEPLAVDYDELVVGGRLQIYDEVVGKGYFSVYARKDQLIFQAGNYVGLIPINERIAIDVRPRVPIRSLERLLRIAGAQPIVIRREL